MNKNKIKEIIDLEDLLLEKADEYWDIYYQRKSCKYAFGMQIADSFSNSDYLKLKNLETEIEALEKLLKEKKDSYEGDFEEDYSKYKAELDIEKLQNQVKDLKSEIKELKEEIVKLKNTQSKPKRKWLNIFKKQ